MPKPLKKKTIDGLPYIRPLDIESCLERLEAISPEERIHLFSVSYKKNSNYIPSEALVYFLRQAWANNKLQEFEQIFKLLMKRLDSSLHSTISDAHMARAQEIREEIISKFAERIAHDCNGKIDWLDYYEIHFNSAIKELERSVLRKIGSLSLKTVPLVREDAEDTELSPEIEAAAEAFFSNNQSKVDDPAFRSIFYAAIDTLPNDQKQVIGLCLKDIPIDSQDPDAITIARIIGCNERTVRNRRDRAFKTLKTVLQEEWMQ